MIEIRPMIIYGRWRLKKEGMRELPGVMGFFSNLIRVVVAQMNIFIKNYSQIHLGSVYFTFFFFLVTFGNKIGEGQSQKGKGNLWRILFREFLARNSFSLHWGGVVALFTNLRFSKWGFKKRWLTKLWNEFLELRNRDLVPDSLGNLGEMGEVVTSLR